MRVIQRRAKTATGSPGRHMVRASVTTEQMQVWGSGAGGALVTVAGNDGQEYTLDLTRLDLARIVAAAQAAKDAYDRGGRKGAAG